MPEGPSIVILKEQLEIFKGQKVLSAEGNAKIDIARMQGLKITDFKSWGKHFLICFDTFFLRIHLLMFGTYTINERKETAPRLRLKFKNKEFSFYTCSIKMMEGKAEDVYDWESDVMSPQWNNTKAEKAVKKLKNDMVCDALLNQEIFSGVGNIIKNEVLFRTKIHPESLVGALPEKKLKEMVKDAHSYSHLFYEWKKIFELKKHWQIYKKRECPRCKLPVKAKRLGKTHRLTSCCANCQKLYEI